jgi:hypothetical protein
LIVAVILAVLAAAVLTDTKERRGRADRLPPAAENF